MECSFFFEVVAPNGFEKIEGPIKESGLDFSVYLSHFNNKKILKSGPAGIIDVGMDASTTEIMHGSGYIEAEFTKAKLMMETLSNIFRTAGFKHRVGVSDENEENTVWYKYQCS